MKKAMTYIYPVISVVAIFFILSAFNEYDGFNALLHGNDAAVIIRFLMMILAGLVLGLEHWLSPTITRSKFIMIERIVLGIVIIAMSISSLHLFSQTSIWVWMLVAGYEFSAAISQLFLKKKQTIFKF